MATPDGLDARLAKAEALVPGIRPGCERRIVWAGAPGVVTDWAVVFIHGYSASALELAPLPQMVAQALGANLHLARLTGHGQDGAAMGRATLADWQADTREAMDIAGKIGHRTLAIGCSTGCTLLTLALAERPIAGVVMVSPNYRLSSRFGQWILDWPLTRRLAPLIAGRQITFPVVSPGHAAGWTTSYPVQALYPMADSVRAARRVDLSRITTPAMFAFTETDRVVHPPTTHRVIARWGAPTTHRPLTPGPGDDPNGHVMAGDVFSPGQTAPLARAITDWARAL
jgi:esterase/lipase